MILLIAIAALCVTCFILIQVNYSLAEDRNRERYYAQKDHDHLLELHDKYENDMETTACEVADDIHHRIWGAC